MEYKYYKEVTGELVRVHIEQDTTPENPRYDWDGNIGHMMCWHRNYQLGDYKENSYSDNLDFLNNLLRARVSESTILNFVKNHRAANFLTLDYDRDKKVWVLGQELRHEIPNFRVIEENEKKEWLVDLSLMHCYRPINGGSWNAMLELYICRYFYTITVELQ